MVVLCCPSEGLAYLTVGLVRPWGEVFPRWMPVVGDVARVERTGAVLLVLLTLYGALDSLFGFVEEGPRIIGQERELERPDAWVGWLYLPAAAWGFLLLAVAGDYARRARTGARGGTGAGGGTGAAG